MSYNPVNTSSRSNSPVFFSGQHYSQQGYNQSSFTDDLTEPHYLPYREDQDISPPSLMRHQQLLQPIPSRNPIQQEEHEAFASSSSSYSLQQHSFHTQPQQHQFTGETNVGSSFTSGYYPPSPKAMKSFHGARGAASSAGSFGGRDNSSRRSSVRNLAVNKDLNYNTAQSDSALEVLADRWNAHQAWWAKQYKEQPFYKIWTKSKWLLLFSAILLLGYSSAAFAIAFGYFDGRYDHAVVVMEFHGNLVYITLFGSALGIFCALLGLVGIFRESRLLLSFYSLLLWPVFGLYVSVGYIAFRRAKNHLRAHLRDEWVHGYTRKQRLIVQRNLKCCGYQDPTWFGEYDLRCFPMINLPGCQHKYNLYEEKLLSTCWTASFALVPFQLFVMIVALLCSNHVNGMLRSGRPGLKSFKDK